MISEFLEGLKSEKMLSVSTIRGYRAAISSTLKPLGCWGHDWDDTLSSLMSNIALECHSEQSDTPAWDINSVLRYLVSIGPSSELSLELLTRKTAFLLALACSTRVSELHALSARVVFDEGGMSVAVLPGFLAKTQVPNTKPQSWVVPGLPEGGDTTLCPVRTVKEYLRATEGVRRGRKNLFIHWVPDRHFTGKSLVSAWLVTTVKDAYRSLGLPLPQSVKVHESRAISTSIAWDHGVAINKFIEAGTWSSPSSFRQRYRREVDSFSLPVPIVAAMSVINV